jgi:hypothetical protein
MLRNQSHDSISGSSVDEVDVDMQRRFVTVGQVADRVTRQGLASLACGDDPWTYQAPRMPSAAVLNVLPFARRGPLVLGLPEALVGAGHLAARVDGRPAPLQVTVGEGARSAVVDVSVAGMGAAAVEVRVADEPEVATASDAARFAGDASIENGRYRVTASADGSLTLVDKRTGRVVHGCHRFEDVADRGDLYTFCPCLRTRRGSCSRRMDRCAHGSSRAARSSRSSR